MEPEEIKQNTTPAAEELKTLLLNALPYAPNLQQSAVIGALARFCTSDSLSGDRVFLINGYAGTGKTSLCGALVKALEAMKIDVVLLAPTGRAAKVFGSYAGKDAWTIHRKIYRHYLGGGVGRTPADNRHPGAVFIVDEASMIGNSETEGSSLLEDLLQYVYSVPGCRLILLGDTAQLPPVGCLTSPAMDSETLKSYGLQLSRANLTSTVRQQLLSGILYNATWLRKAMAQDTLPLPKIFADQFKDVHIISGEELPEELESSYRSMGLDQTILITRSNQRATQFNKAIREQVLYLENKLSPGEPILITKNNYFWTEKVKGMDFVANGEVAYVDHIIGTEDKYGLCFADVSLVLPHLDNSFEAKVVLDTLTSDSPALPNDRYQQLFNDIWYDTSRYPAGDTQQQRLNKIRRDPYFNALQIKYAYAVTCHKAQGGQWENVFVDLGYIPQDAMGMDFYRWLYTAITRAKGNVYIINPDANIIK